MENRQSRGNRIKNEESRRRAKGFKILFIVMAVLILLFDLIFIFVPDKEISETENRTLQQFPQLNFTTLTNGKFESRFDSYVADQFPARDFWVHMKSTVDRFAGKTENNHIYLCADGYLIQDLLIPSDEIYQEKMDAVRKVVSENGTLKISALIAPTALSVLRDHLPLNAPAADEDVFFDQVKEDLSGMGIHFVDTREALKKAAEEEQVFYRTDHHWTTAGAYAAYLKFAEELSLSGKATAYKKDLVTDSFSGTLTASSGFRSGETDPVHVYLPNPEKDYSVFYVEEGQRKTSFYEMENLNVRDKYSIFFNGNHPEIKIDTDADSKDILLVIKDSYANCFVPFLAADYKTIIMVDPRYFTGDLQSLIDTEGVTDILYLYNIATFAE